MQARLDEAFTNSANVSIEDPARAAATRRQIKELVTYLATILDDATTEHR